MSNHDNFFLNCATALCPGSPTCLLGIGLLCLCEKDSYSLCNPCSFFLLSANFKIPVPSILPRGKEKIGLCPCFFSRTLRVYWVSMVQLAPFLHTGTIGLACLILFRLTAFLQSYNSEQRDLMSFLRRAEQESLSLCGCNQMVSSQRSCVARWTGW